MTASFLTPWRCVAAAFALNGVFIGSWAARIPAVMARHGLDNGQLGLLFLLIGLGALASFTQAGGLADRLGAARVTRWCALAYAVTLVAIGLAPSVWMLGLVLMLFGASHGAMDVTMNAWASDVEKRLGRSAMSSIHAMWSFGAGAGAAGGYVASALGLSVAVHFAVIAVVWLGLAWPFIGPSASAVTAPKAKPGAETAKPQSPRRKRQPVLALPRGALILVGLIALSSGLGEGAMADWSAVYLRDVVGLEEARAALGYALFSISMVSVRLVVDGAITRAGPVAVARVSALTAALGILLVTGPATATSSFIGFVLMGAGYAALIPLAFSRAASDPHVPPGQAIAAVSTLGYGAMLLGPPVIGQISELGSLRLAFALLGGFAVLVALLSPVLARDMGARRAVAQDG